MDEHHWKFKVGSRRYDRYRAIRDKGFASPRIEGLSGGEWVAFAVGQPIAEEMLRLAAVNEGLRKELHRCCNEAIEATHDLSVKLELAVRRVKELEAALEEEENSSSSLRLSLEEAEARARELEVLAARMGERDGELLAKIGELRTEVAAKEATIHMAVARLGGMVEGAPTHRINFLQRIDELRKIERLREDDPLA